MRYATDTSTFDPDNRAYQRFLTLVGEHFDVVGWDHAHTGRPVMTTLIDLGSGDMFTVALVDSLEHREPYALLAVTTAHEMRAYGPLQGEVAAGTVAPRLAMADPTIAATRPMPLHDPAVPHLADDAWQPLPPDVANTARPAPLDAAGEVAVVLIDSALHLVAVAGPLPDRATADTWQPHPPVPPHTRRLVVPLHAASLDDPRR